jgi:hypothetical protein
VEGGNHERQDRHCVLGDISWSHRNRHSVDRFRTHSGTRGQESQGRCRSGTDQGHGCVHRAIRCREGTRLQAGWPQGREMCGANPLRALAGAIDCTTPDAASEPRTASIWLAHSLKGTKPSATGLRRSAQITSFYCESASSFESHGHRQSEDFVASRALSSNWWTNS